MVAESCPDKRNKLHARPHARAQKILKVFVIIPQNGRQRDMFGQNRTNDWQWQGYHRKRLLGLILIHNDIAFAGFIQSAAIMILIHDRLANHKNLQLLNTVDQTKDILKPVAGGDIAQVSPRLGRKHLEVGIDQLRRTEGDLIGEGDAAADRTDSLFFVCDLAGDILSFPR